MLIKTIKARNEHRLSCLNKGDDNRNFVIKEPGRTRSNGLKLDTLRFNRNIGKNCFTSIR